MRASVPDFQSNTTGTKRYRTGSTFAHYGGHPPNSGIVRDNFLTYIHPANTVISDDTLEEIMKEAANQVKELRQEADDLQEAKEVVLQRHSEWRDFLNEVIQAKSPMYSYEGSIYSRKDGSKLTQKKRR